MSHLISTWSKNLKTVPESYVFPPGQRPGDDIVPICKSIPVLDLGLEDRCHLAKKMVNASAEYGVFQVVNHGVSESLMKETAKLFEEFFDMPQEVKESFTTDELKSPTKLYTSSMMYTKDKVHSWRDTLNHQCHPLEEHILTWPHKPTQYREVVGEYTIAVKKMSSMIMSLIAEGLGLEKSYFEKLSGSYGLAVNNYPACPNPSLVWGAMPHHDPNVFTILQQWVYGLQVLKGDKWIGVEVIPDGFIVQNSFQIEVITNGKLKSTLHRVQTNTKTTRMSLANIIGPTFDAFVEPAKGLINADNPPRYKSYFCGELMKNLFANYGNTTPALYSYKLKEKNI